MARNDLRNGWLGCSLVLVFAILVMAADWRRIMLAADWLIQTGQGKGWLLIGSSKAPMNLPTSLARYMVPFAFPLHLF